MADVGGDVVLLRSSGGPRVRFLEQVRVRDYKETSEETRSPLAGGLPCAERVERLKGSCAAFLGSDDGDAQTGCSSRLRRRRKCALVVLSSADSADWPADLADADTATDSEDEADEERLRAFLANCPADRDLQQPIVSLILAAAHSTSNAHESAVVPPPM